MLRKAIVPLVFLIAVNMTSAQDLACQRDCFAVEAFSAANVHRIRSLGAEPPGVHELAWQQTGPMLFMLGDGHYRTEKPGQKELVVWQVAEDPKYGEYVIGQGITVDEFTHLAVTSDILIAGTDAGSLSFWELRGIWERLGKPFSIKSR